MSRLALVLLIFLAAYMALAQPGLCTCWLIRDVHTYHPHLAADPERPHSHFYLIEFYNSQTVANAPPFLTPARTLILALALGGLWRRISHTTMFVAGWTSPPLIPPPRLRVSF
jgi:hypothetical protein